MVDKELMEQADILKRDVMILQEAIRTRIGKFAPNVTDRKRIIRTIKTLKKKVSNLYHSF